MEVAGWPSQPENRGSARNPRPWGAVLLLVLLLTQCLLAVQAKSPTFDEPAYIAAGYLYLTRGAFDVDAEHPPLFKYVLALPLLPLPLLPPEQVPNWNNGAPQQFVYGASFLFRNSVDAERMLHAARYVVVAVAVLLGVLVWTWARQLYGSTAGGLALLMYCVCPNVIAHSSLATLDVAVSGCMAAALYCLWRLYRRPTLPWALAGGTTLAAAVLVKCSAAILLGLMPLFLAAAILRNRRLRTRRDARRNLPPQTSYHTTHETQEETLVSSARLLALTALALAVAAMLVHCAWGPGHSGLAKYASTLNLVAFRRDLLMDQTYERFCWGRYSAKGFPWYFFAAFLLKTPLPTIILILAIIAWRTTRRIRPSFDELFLMLPVPALFLSTAFVRENIGVRYILPVHPLLFVLIGGFVVSLARRVREAKGPTWVRAIWPVTGACLFAWYVGGTLRIAPHYLAFFNELAGGPANGIRYLDDSNIDWGQDLKTLSRYLHDHDIKEIRLLYTPVYLADVAVPYYGIKARGITLQEIVNPEKGWYAVSAHALQRPAVAIGPRGEKIRFNWLDRFEPVARIGYSIYLYRFD